MFQNNVKFVSTRVQISTCLKFQYICEFYFTRCCCSLIQNKIVMLVILMNLWNMQGSHPSQPQGPLRVGHEQYISNKQLQTRHKLSGIASHFATQYSWFATQHRFCIDNSTNDSTTRQWGSARQPDRSSSFSFFNIGIAQSQIKTRKIVRFETTRK